MTPILLGLMRPQQTKQTNYNVNLSRIWTWIRAQKSPLNNCGRYSRKTLCVEMVDTLCQRPFTTDKIVLLAFDTLEGKSAGRLLNHTTFVRKLIYCIFLACCCSFVFFSMLLFSKQDEPNQFEHNSLIMEIETKIGCTHAFYQTLKDGFFHFLSFSFNRLMCSISGFSFGKIFQTRKI